MISIPTRENEIFKIFSLLNNLAESIVLTMREAVKNTNLKEFESVPPRFNDIYKKKLK